MNKILIFDDLVFYKTNTEIIAFLLNFIIVFFYAYNLLYFIYYFYSNFYNYIYNNFTLIKQNLFNNKIVYMFIINIFVKIVRSYIDY